MQTPNTKTPQKLPFKKLSGFTLVELIVVITILVILGTIAFLNLGGFQSNARDGTRISDMNNIETGLSVFQIKSGIYPDPEAPVNIEASGTVLNLQGYFGDLTSNIIKMSSTPVDPTDKMKYVYTVNAIKTKYQLMVYLEEMGNVNMVNKDIIPAAYAIDYSKRYPKVSGSDIGILLLSGSLAPVQEDITLRSAGKLDIVNTTGSYIIQISATEKISGTGIALKSGIIGGGLVGYWDFDLGSGTTVIANKTKSNTKSNIFQDVINFSYSGGKLGKGLYFTGASSTGLTLDLGTSYQDFTDGATISFWVKTFSGSYNGAGNAFVSMGNYWCHLYANSSIDKTYVRFIPNSLYLTNKTTLNDLVNPFYSFLRKTIGSTDYVNSSYIDEKFHLHTISFNDGGKINYFIDNMKIFSKTDKLSTLDQQFIFSGSIDSYSLQKIAENTVVNGTISRGTSLTLITGYKNGTMYNPNSVILGQSGFGIIDELRIYNRALSDSEILALYNATK